MAVTQQDIRNAVRELGLSEQPLCVHSSLRSFGWVEGGADAVIDGLLTEGCTVLAPTMCWDFAVTPPLHLRPPRNGTDYHWLDLRLAAGEVADTKLDYTPASNAISKTMGAIPAALLARPKRERGSDPKGSFAALGPLAHDLIRYQTATDPFSQLRELAVRGGSVVLMGVGLDRLTLLHLAEAVAGRNLFMRWANGPDGKASPVFGGGCSAGFPRLEPFLSHLIREFTVGGSLWKVLPAKETLAAGATAIRADPSITHCADDSCISCNDAVLGGPILRGF